VLPINHMVVVKQELSDNHPDVVREVHRMLSAAAKHAPPDFNPGDISRSLEMISQYAAQQGLIPRAYAADEMFDDLTRTLR
jgi:4,5-dihydroxyphthalate decarboxylase